MTMQELQGFMPAVALESGALKRKALLFDKLQIWDIDRSFSAGTSADFVPELDYLREKDFLGDVNVCFSFRIDEQKTNSDSLSLGELGDLFSPHGDSELARIFEKHYGKRVHSDPDDARSASISGVDMITRQLIEQNKPLSDRWVPICFRPLQRSIKAKSGACGNEDVLRVAFKALPVPDEGSAWPDIFDFRDEFHDKQWHFRRWLESIVNSQRTEAEVRDELEWFVNEYAKAMNIHKLKARHSFLEVYVVPTLETFEDIVKFNWSKIAKGALSVQKTKVELLEAEMKAPGRECAYVFDARNRFGQSPNEIAGADTKPL